MTELVLAMVLLAPPDGGVARADAGLKDAGVTEAPRATVDVAAVTEAAVAPLRKRVTDLESRTAELERKAHQLEATSQRLDELSRDFASFKRDVEAREDERAESERRAAERRQRTDAVTRGLVVADQQLASGANPAAIAETLRAAEATYSGAALQYVQAARVALSNGDLASARRLIGLAVLEVQVAPAKE